MSDPIDVAAGAEASVSPPRPPAAEAGADAVARAAGIEALMEEVEALWAIGRRIQGLERQAQAARLFPRLPVAHVVSLEALLLLGRGPEAHQTLQAARLLMTARVHPGLRRQLERLAVELAALPRSEATTPPEARRKEKRHASRNAPRSGAVGPYLHPPRRSISPTRAGEVPRVELHFRPPNVDGALPLPADPALALDDYRLRLDAQAFARLQSFEHLLALALVRGVDHYEYQLRTVRRVLGEFHGRALLADEVGLGKTVEACLCLKEYLLRGLVKRALVLVPPALRAQWRDELANKFGIEARVVEGDAAREDPDLWAQDGVLLASIGVARLEPHASHIAKQQFDLLIVDEAHRLKNRNTRSWQLVDRLRARFLLLLSATPVENDLVEIHNVLSLLKPGLFSTEAEFKRTFLASGKSRAVKDPVRLRALLREVMIRNTRALAEARLPPRYAATLRARPGELEAELLARAAAAVRSALAVGTLARGRAGEILRAVGSSPHAGAAQLTGVDPALAERFRALATPAKDALLGELMAKRSGEKVLLFAAHLATLEHAAEVARRAGRRVALFHGQLSGPEKEAAIGEFRGPADVLVSSESGGEGFNLQFARTIVNYDLPWNPMRIEQRIGRVHRIGQTREVFIFNLVTAGTIEEEILRILDEKIAMFELVVGEVESILGRLGDDEQEFQELVLELYAGAADPDEVRARFDALGERMLAARGAHETVKALEEAAFGRDLEA